MSCYEWATNIDASHRIGNPMLFMQNTIHRMQLWAGCDINCNTINTNLFSMSEFVGFGIQIHYSLISFKIHVTLQFEINVWKWTHRLIYANWWRYSTMKLCWKSNVNWVQLSAMYYAYQIIETSNSELWILCL